MDGNEKEIRALVSEKGRIEGRLMLAGGNDFSFLLEDCSDLSDIIDGIDDVSSQMGEKEHAAFEAKVKFSRKVRRKAKDLNNFEQHLVKEYENGHITLEHGKMMVSIIKLLRSKSVDRAKREAREFYGFLEMGARLGIINELLLKKRAQVERAKCAAEARLSDLEWLEAERPVAAEMAGRHDETVQLRGKLSEIWSNYAQTLKSMPAASLLKKMEREGLGGIGFPEISEQEAESLASFLQKSKLDGKTAEQLYEMTGQSEQRLRHSGVDLPLFRQEVVARKSFLFGIMSFSADLRALETGQAALTHLSRNDEGAGKIVERLAELNKTGEQDRKEWERAGMIRQKREALGGADRAALEKSLQELRALQDVLDGKAAPVETGENEKRNGIIGSILKFLGGK